MRTHWAVSPSGCTFFIPILPQFSRVQVYSGSCMSWGLTHIISLNPHHDRPCGHDYHPISQMSGLRLRDVEPLAQGPRFWPTAWPHSMPLQSNILEAEMKNDCCGFSGTKRPPCLTGDPGRTFTLELCRLSGESPQGL